VADERKTEELLGQTLEVLLVYLFWLSAQLP
jgi:hypothetical protein